MVNGRKEEMVAGDTSENFVAGGGGDGEVAQDENVTNLNESAELDTEMAVVKEAASTHEERDGRWPTKERDGQLQGRQALEDQKAASAETVPAMEESSRRPERLDKKRSPELPMQRRNSKRLHTIAETGKIMDHAHAMDVEDNLGAKPRRRGRRSTDKSTPNSTEFAAITPKNIDLIYLRRTLLRELLGDPEFRNKVVGSFVRIRIPALSSEERPYRLVLVTGTRNGEDDYKAGPTKTTNILVEVLYLLKKEVVTVNEVSDEDFTEEECQGLRQRIKNGFIKPLTVRQVEEKAIALREDKLNHWLESEKQRMIDLQDRANEVREWRACEEKLQELSDPEFRAAKFEEAMPVKVTSDGPHVDPGYESDALDPEESLHHRSKDSLGDHGLRGYYAGRRSGENLGPCGDTKAAGSIPVSGQVTRSRPEIGRKDISSATQASRSALRTPIEVMLETEEMWHYQDPTGVWQGHFSTEKLREYYTTGYLSPNMTIWKTGDNTENSELWLSDALAGRINKEILLKWLSKRRGHHSSSMKRGASGDSALGMDKKYPSQDEKNHIPGVASDKWNHGNSGRIDLDPTADDPNFRRREGKAPGSTPVFKDPWEAIEPTGSTPVFEQVTRPRVRSEVVSSAAQASRSALRTPIGVISETEKMWHLRDPTGMVQGPFSMEQLRKWNTNLTIWKTGNNKQNSEVLLTDALAGKFTLLEGSSTGRGDHRNSRSWPRADSHMLVASPKVVDVWGSLGDGGSRKSMYGRSYDAAKARDGSRSGSATDRVRERKDVPCRHHFRGYCERGKDCAFRHS